MATKVFTGALVDFVSASGRVGGDWDTVVEPAWTLTDNVNGSSGTVVYTPTLGTEQLLGVAGSLVDDATVPAVITMTAVRIAFSWSITCAGATTIGDSVTQTSVGAGGGSGSFDVTEDPTAYLGGTDRASLFAVPSVVWAFFSVGASASQAVTVSSYTVTVTYTSPASVISIRPISGSVNGGQAFTIRGTGLSAVTAVTFGGTAATSIVATDTTITGVTPAHVSGAVTVTVTGLGDVPGGYTYIIPPPFDLDPLPGRTPIMQGKGT